MPQAIFLKIDSYTGPQYFTDPAKHNWIPITSLILYSKAANATRIQYPLRLGYSITTHKTQGNLIDYLK